MKKQAVHETKDRQAVRSRPAVRIEYPRDGERLQQPFYTFRVGAIPEASFVQLCIDQGEWLACREALGLWWYDWTDLPAGEHVAVARSRAGDGVWVASEPRRFSVA